MRLPKLTAALLLTLSAVAVPPTASASPARSLDHPVWTRGCHRAPGLPPGQTVERAIDSGGHHRTYLIHLPAGYDRDRPVPVVLAFHGRKGDGSKIEAFSGIDALDAIAVYPRGLPGESDKTAWQGAPYAAPVDDVRFVSDLLDRLQATLCVDRHRIYATGKSNGGGFTALLACRLPHRIAAFATVAGAFYPETGEGCHAGTPVPILDFHGTADTIIEYGGGESHGEPFPSIPDWLRRWAEHNRCWPPNSSPTSTPIGPDVTKVAWHRCAAHSALVHYRVAGAGHTWPGELVDSGPGSATQTIAATTVMWDFFLAHPLVR